MQATPCGGVCLGTPTSPAVTFTQRSPNTYPRTVEYYAIWSGSGSITITCNLLSSPYSLGCVAFAVSGANTASPFDTSTSGSAFCGAQAGSFLNNAHTCSLTTTNANDFIYGFAMSEAEVGIPTISAGLGFTSIKTTDEYYATSDQSCPTYCSIGESEYAITSSATTYSVAFTMTGTCCQYTLGDAIVSAGAVPATTTTTTVTVTTTRTVTEPTTIVQSTTQTETTTQPTTTTATTTITSLSTTTASTFAYGSLGVTAIVILIVAGLAAWVLRGRRP